MITNKTYQEKAKDIKIINEILLYICGDSNSEREDEFAAQIEQSTEGEITKEEFHDWISEFDIQEYVEI